MRDALVDLLDKVDIAVAESRGVLDPAHLEPSARLAADTRLRLSYPEEILVVALAGGTGSGKSSVFNAIAGAELALTGGIRPMTVAPLVAIPEQHAGTMGGYLDAMGIADRIGHAGPSWLCLIDLPDSDSVELDHRYRARALLPRVDMVIWVTDPEKYRDATLHREQIGPLAGYQEQFLFVLNQVDRLAAEEVRSVLADLVDAR
jgi:predicted GTPase